MVVKTDEEWLAIVDRFDVPLEDTVDVERLQRALAEKLEAAGVPYVAADFLDRFQRGLEQKYAALPEAGVSFKSYFREPTPRYPAGFWQPIYRDIPTGRFISKATVAERIPTLRL